MTKTPQDKTEAQHSVTSPLHSFLQFDLFPINALSLCSNAAVVLYVTPTLSAKAETVTQLHAGNE